MSRLRADIYLFIVAILWGFAFVAQKSGMDGIGPFTFVATRFVLSAAFVLPFLFIEFRKQPPLSRKAVFMTIPTALACAVGVCLQQVGLQNTSVTNAGFITSLYVVFTPFIAWLVFRVKLSWVIWPSCLLSIVGLWFLNGGTLLSLSWGDLLVLACAICYACHVASTGWYLTYHDRPIFLSIVQYMATMLLGAAGMFMFETVSVSAIVSNWLPILYAGIISGGIAYTLQAVAQRRTPASDAAIILSAESIFAALAGFLLLKEEFTGAKMTGCGLILIALLLVQINQLRLESREKL